VDQDRIKDLMMAMDEHGITKLQLKEGEEEILLEKAVAQMVANIPHAIPEAHYVVKDPIIEKSEIFADEAQYVTSPMVGTFFESPSPDSPAFIKIGDHVNEDSVVCIIEAMKVMNEIKAGVKGRVEAVLVETSHPIEFGTKLFKII